MATQIRGIEGMKHSALDFEIQRGGKDVTEAVVNSLRAQAAPAQPASPHSAHELNAQGSSRPPHRVNYRFESLVVDTVWVSEN